MATTEYTVTVMSGDRWTMLFDATQASAPIQHQDSEGDVHSTPYQTASAGHSPVRATEMLANYWGRQSGDHDEVDSVQVR